MLPFFASLCTYSMCIDASIFVCVHVRVCVCVCVCVCVFQYVGVCAKPSPTPKRAALCHSTPLPPGPSKPPGSTPHQGPPRLNGLEVPPPPPPPPPPHHPHPHPTATPHTH